VRAWRVLEARPLRPLEAWVGRLAAVAVMALPLLADAGALPGPRAPSVGLPLTGGTMTGAIVFDDGLGGPSTAITSGTGNDIVVAPAGTRRFTVTNPDTSVTTSDWTDFSFNLRDVTNTYPYGIRIRAPGQIIEFTNYDFNAFSSGTIKGTALIWDAQTTATINGPSGITLSHATTASGNMTFSADVKRSVVSPGAFTGTQDNYAGCAGAQVCRLSGSSTPKIDGMTGGSGVTERALCNIGAADISIVHEAAGSTAANRFDLEGSVDYTLVQKSCRQFIYDSTSSRWRALK
jgi:hypothetical protein